MTDDGDLVLTLHVEWSETVLYSTPVRVDRSQVLAWAAANGLDVSNGVSPGLASAYVDAVDGPGWFGQANAARDFTAVAGREFRRVAAVVTGRAPDAPAGPISRA